MAYPDYCLGWIIAATLPTIETLLQEVTYYWETRELHLKSLFSKTLMMDFQFEIRNYHTHCQLNGLQLCWHNYSPSN